MNWLWTASRKCWQSCLPPTFYVGPPTFYVGNPACLLPTLNVNSAQKNNSKKCCYFFDDIFCCQKMAANMACLPPLSDITALRASYPPASCMCLSIRTHACIIQISYHIATTVDTLYVEKL